LPISLCFCTTLALPPAFSITRTAVQTPETAVAKRLARSLADAWQHWVTIGVQQQLGNELITAKAAQSERADARRAVQSTMRGTIRKSDD
jgi:hypothetical protein